MLARASVRRWAGCLVAGFVIWASGDAHAADPTYGFVIPRKPLAAALVDFAIQSNISVGTGRIGPCAGVVRSLVGRYSVRAGLDRLLSGSGCGFRRLDAGAYEIVRLTPPAIAPASVARPSAAADVADIVVVATGRPAPADRLAYAVSAYEKLTLESDGVVDTSGLSMVTPAMTVTNLGMGRDKILLRGLSDGPLTGQAQSMVSLYLDDTRLTYNAPDPDLRLVDIARVEVLRGPQGALYGAGSMGGVVHLVTAQPDATRFSGWAAATTGATQGGADSQSLDAVVNAPLFGGRAAVRGVLYEEFQGGYMKDAALGVPNANSSERVGGRLAIALYPDAAWTLSAGLVSQSINSADTQYSIAGQPAYTRDNVVREPHDNDFNEFHLSARGEFGWGELRWSTSYIQHSLSSRYDASAAPPVPLPSGPAAFDEAQKIDSTVTEAIATSSGDAPIGWLLGVFYAHTQQTAHDTLTSLNAPVTLALDELRRDRLDEAAVYWDVVAPLSPRLSLTLGGRLFAAPTSVTGAMSAPLLAASNFYAGKVGNRVGFAPKLVVSYSPSATALIYIQAAEGYRSDGINTIGAPGQVFTGAGGPEPNRNFEGDELWNLEVGGSLDLLDGRARLRMAAYEAFWKNIQSDQLSPSGLPYTANLGDGRNGGLEFEGSYRDGPLELHGEFLVNAPELTRANSGFSSQADYGLSSVPDVSAGVSGHYAWPLGDDGSLAVDGRWTYAGASRLALTPGSALPIGPYSTARLAATLAKARWALTLAVDNPGDVRGDTFGYGNPFTERFTQQITPLRPRSVSLKVEFSY
jgi:outer membrane receptor protein involved in Fe transport